MARTGPETEALRNLTAELPSKVVDWTSDQRSEHEEQSNAAMREQADATTPQLGRGK
jgi:hypothetical protein